MIIWNDMRRFSIGEVDFKRRSWTKPEEQSTLDELLVFKERWMLDRYATLIKNHQPKQIFELGIDRGGSCVFFHKLASAEKLVAIELDTQRIEAVDQYIEMHKLENSLIPLYGVNQADSEGLKQIVDEEFGDKGLDLVIDDASHFLDETRSSFNTLFPRMNRGGIYIIEDWSWAHKTVDNPDEATGFFPDREPLTKLIFELVLACSSTRGLINKIEINRNSATIWRGGDEIEAEGFDIAQCSLARGRNLIA